MFIVPISPMGKLDGIKPLSGESKIGSIGEENNGVGFKDILNDVIGNVQSTEATVNQDTYNLATGKTDDMHTIMINAAKADMALQTMVQLRNKIVEAYTEVMRINL
ncbi:MAG: flagellar hook-basal body complex protein FliE [Eubacteriales bacterium]